MKKAMFAVLAAMVVSNSAFAQMKAKPMGQGAQSSMYASSDSMAWGIALGTLVVVGTVVGFTVAAATANVNSH